MLKLDSVNKGVLVGIFAATAFLLANSRRLTPSGPKGGTFPVNPAPLPVPVPFPVPLPSPSPADDCRVCFPVSPWGSYYSATGFSATGSQYGGRTDLHTGLDLNLKTGGDTDRGKPVYAVAAGVVAHVGYTASGWGHFLVIFHPALGVWTRYAHLDARPAVSVGAAVRLGQIVGKIGKSGGQRYAHLHFDVLRRKPTSWADWPGADRDRLLRDYTDPLPWLLGVQAHDRSSYLA
ncbi:M23 family metallopeptidase (plasmid) [Deinococcus aquaticus]|uniref:M23 family metallopeptidase n=1 Tax=Deinococcus aquaticus TaxID=328692 RepID=A0ABY7V6R5_9DEIO|nr:M23 family metallopeptidase [Deinococcus aquaticus]WDA60820.1 M23 family metallopeptidase [Deinococcus aquaticus]